MVCVCVRHSRPNTNLCQSLINLYTLAQTAMRYNAFSFVPSSLNTQFMKNMDATATRRMNGIKGI